MKFKVTMKTPGGLDAAMDRVITDATRNEEGEIDEAGEEKALELQEEISELCERWFQYGEYLTVEIDTENKTCTVVEIPVNSRR